MSYTELVDKERVPGHVAIIMDGNGRWAKAKGQPRQAGHVQGVESVKLIAEWAVRLGIKYLTIYAFSTENWNRPKEEVDALFALLFENLKNDNLFMDNNISCQIIGDLSRLSEERQEKIRQFVNKTSANTGMHMVIALSYSSRWEITEAAKEIARKVTEGSVSLDSIDEKLLCDNMKTAGVPDPDLLIRTGGEIRLSNFLLWQAAYAELYFCDTLWPEFDEEELCKAVYTFQQKERRFGMTSAQVSQTQND